MLKLFRTASWDLSNKKASDVFQLTTRYAFKKIESVIVRGKEQKGLELEQIGGQL